MGDIISTVLSAISSEPIFVLGIIFVVLSGILKSNKSDEEDQQQDTYETTTNGGMTWEDMERAYGIKMERKIEDTSSAGSGTDTSMSIEIFHESQNTAEPVPILGTLQQYNHQQEAQVVTDAPTVPNEVDAYHTTEVVKRKKKKKAKKSAEPTLQERLAEYNRESAAALQMVELAQTDDDHATTVEKKQKSPRQPISVKEGMRWSIILDKPKALQMRPR